MVTIGLLNLPIVYVVYYFLAKNVSWGKKMRTDS